MFKKHLSLHPQYVVDIIDLLILVFTISKLPRVFLGHTALLLILMVLLLDILMVLLLQILMVLLLIILMVLLLEILMVLCWSQLTLALMLP